MAIKVKTKVVKFSDGSTITVSQANWDISMELSALEKKAQENPDDNPDIQLFRLAFYPKLKASTIKGNVPTEKEARAMPEDDLDLWFKAVRDLNLKWFVEVEELTEEASKKKDSGG